MTAMSGRPHPTAGFARKVVRRLALLGVLAVGTNGMVAAVGPSVSTANAANTIQNPLLYNGQPASCPDAAGINGPAPSQITISCTTNYGEDNPLGVRDAAFSEFQLTTMKALRFINFVFPPNHHPSLAAAPTGTYKGGEYWSDQIVRFNGEWLDYFAAAINYPAFNRTHKHQIHDRQMGIFVAWTKSPYGGNWHSRLLHYAGEYNSVPGNDQEVDGGLIDPSVAWDSTHTKLYMVYTKQQRAGFITQLSPDGLHMTNRVKVIMGPSKPWECNSQGRQCTVEGMVIFADPHNPGVMDMTFNANNTWGTDQSTFYRVGFAASTDPMRRWTKYAYPILQSGDGLNNPGVGGAPVTGPDGNSYEFFHVTDPVWNPALGISRSQQRFLAVGRFDYNSGHKMLIPRSPDGHAARVIDVPEINKGKVTRSVTLGK